MLTAPGALVSIPKENGLDFLDFFGFLAGCYRDKTNQSSMYKVAAIKLVAFFSRFNPSIRFSPRWVLW